MHSGLNLNNSNFSDEAIGKASPSLRNIPLLAFVKKTDGSGEADFAGHEFEFKITEDGIKYVYLGRPIGMIPETNNYSYEEDEEGVKFVSADAYIWNQYANEAMDIIQRDGSKSVSMEISVDNYEVDDKVGVMDITDFKYTGVAILGDDVQPAMRNARLDLASFSFDGLGDFMATFAKEIKETLNHEKPEAETPKGLPVSDTTIGKIILQRVLKKQVSLKKLKALREKEQLKQLRQKQKLKSKQLPRSKPNLRSRLKSKKRR